MSGLARYEATGSSLLDELIVRRKQIRARMRPSPRRAKDAAALRLLPPSRSVFPAPKVPPATLEERLHEVDTLRGKVPWNKIRKMIDCIIGSAQDCGEDIPKLYEPRPPRIALSGKPTVSEIQKFVAHHFTITQFDILCSRRTMRVRRPRQIAMYLSRLLTPRSLCEIGRRFGCRHHTTVLHAVRNITALVETDAGLAEEIESLKRMLLE